MDMQCGTCSLQIDTNTLYTICEGRCAKRFHGKCVRVCEEDLRALSQNIVWICDDCMVHFRKVRDMNLEPVAPMPNPMENKLKELKAQAEGIIAAIDSITHCAEVPISIHRHSTPVASPKSLDTTNVCSSHTIEEESFSLLLTNIDCGATEREVAEMVSDSLCASKEECRAITKLVPKWKNCADLDYISFKVVLNNKWRRTAMTATTWPRGVRFREFVNRRDETWKPSIWLQNTV